MAWHWRQSRQMLRRYRIKYPVLALLTIALALLVTVAPARSRIAPARVEGTADVAVERSQFILEKLAQQQEATPSQSDRAVAERVFQEGEQLRNEGTAESLLQAIQKYEQALGLLKKLGDRQWEASTLSRIGLIYSLLGEHKQALNYFNQELLIWQALGDRRWQAVALDNIGKAYQSLGEKQKALDYFKQAKLTQQQVTLSESDRAAAQRAFQEGEKLRNQGTTESLRQAIQKYEEVLQLVKVLGDGQWEANTLNYIGLIYNKLGEKQKALDSFLQALPLVRTLGIQEGEASILTSIGAIYNELGKKQEAINYLHQALALRRALRDPDGEAATLNNLGRLYYSLGENRQALDYYTQALSLRQAAKNRAGEAGILISIGDVYIVLGEKQKAIENYTQALLIWQDLGEEKGKANTLNSLGNLYSSLDEAQKALDYYNQALLLYQKLGDRKGETAALNNIGSMYNFLGEAQKSLDYLNQVLPIVREFGDRNAEAKILSNMGSNYSILNEDQKAIYYYIQALRLFQSVDDKKGEAITLIKIGANLGVSSSDIGQQQQGLDYLNRALLITRDIRARSTEATALHSIGNVYYSLGDKQKALEYFTQSLSIRRAIEDRNQEAITLNNIAAVKQFQGNFKEALADIEAAAKIVESLRTKIINSDLRASYFATNQNIYRRYVDILMAMHRQNPNGGHDIAAFEVSERARARSLIELLNEARADIRQGVDPELRDLERQIQQKLTTKTQYQDQLLKNQHTEEQVETIRKEITELERQLQQVEVQIRATSPRYAELTQPQRLNFKEIQQVVDADTILLSYWLGEERSYVWAVTPTSVTVRELPKRAEIETAAREFYKYLTTPSLFDTADAEEKATTLSQIILAPIAEKLQQKRLLIVGDGELQYTPFSALPVPMSPTTASPKLLIAEHEIVSLPSASTLSIIRESTANRALAPKAVAVLADPVFDAQDERVKASSNPQTSPLLTPNLTRGTESEGETWTRLAGTRKEAERILSLVADSEEMQAFDFDANLDKAADSVLSNYRIVHFATHGFFNTENPQLSGIVLSLVNQQGASENGYLLTPAIFNLNLPAELIVLSGCQTGKGKDVKGEGIVGLTRGFMYAGAKRVMVSLWSVSDQEETPELMSRFYQKMLKDGLPAARALREAQLSMMQEGKEPYYWAPFILQGEWQ